jgi:hypothetical protein
MYYFATFTNRDIVIYDQTAIGAMCQVIQCGFPLVSQLVKVHPQELKWAEVTFLRRINWKMFDTHMSGLANVSEVQVGPYGFQSKSDWWAYNLELRKCVAAITGCSVGDITCSERHALQRLLIGPFLPNASAVIQSQMVGFPDIFKRGVSSVTHNYMPRIDLSLHIRNQFYHFEAGNRNGSDHEYIKEAKEWLNTSEAKLMVQMLKEKIISIITETRPDLLPTAKSGASASSKRRRNLRVGHKNDDDKDSIDSGTRGKSSMRNRGRNAADAGGNNTVTGSTTAGVAASYDHTHKGESEIATTDTNTVPPTGKITQEKVNKSKRRKLRSHGAPPPMIYENAAAREDELRQGPVESMYDKFYIYVAADNEVVKRHLFTVLGQAPEFAGMNVKMLMKESDVQIHSKFIVAKATQKDLEVMRRPMIDLTFDLYVMSLSNNLIAWRKGNSLSTFVSAAQRVSGTRDRTNAQTWEGIGTRGYHLKTSNPPKFEAFPVYPNF